MLDLLGATGAEACRECGERARAERDRLMAENDRLREFVMDLADAIRHDDGFGIDRGWVIERMRELGIEVGE